MADTKITALTALTAADPANDVIPIVDVSDTSMAASGTTKKISVNNILGASGTATLASATITGDLTVDTSTLKVDSANNRVGVLTTSPLYALDVNGDAKVTNALRYFVGSTQYGLSFANAGALGVESYQGTYIFFGTGSGASATERLRIANDGVCTWSNVGGVAGTAMTLNSTGLNIANGNVILGTSGKGIDFSATANGSGTMTSELLNDYEEGTWTGTIGGTTGNPTTPVTATGRYTKIGRQVYVEIGFYGDTTGASSRITVSGLPFTSNASLSRPGAILMDAMGTFTGSPVAFLGSGVTSVDLYASNSNGSLSNVTHNAGAGRALYMALTYSV